MSEPRLRRISERAREWLEKGVAQTYVLLVARRGVVTFHESFGRLTPEPGSPPTPLDAIFELASLTKVITATALMVLVDEGRVGLNRPVSAFIPEFGGEGKDAVLVRNLLTHTSGVRTEDLEKYVRENRGNLPIPPAPGTEHPLFHEYLSLRYGCPLWKPPGAEMSYSNMNFDLAAEIVCRVTGTSLDRFARDRIFEPLGMKDSFYCRIDVPQSRRVREPPSLTISPDLEALEKAAETQRFWMGSNAAWSTALDLATFAQMFLNGGSYGGARVLSPAAVREMTRNQIPGVGASYFGEAFPEASWGYGWSVHGAKTGDCGGLYSSEAFEHSGAGALYLWADPHYELVGVYLSVAPWDPGRPEVSLKCWWADLFTDMATAAVLET